MSSIDSATARRLYDEMGTYRAVADGLGCPLSAVWAAVNPERAAARSAARSAGKQARARASRPRCPECDCQMSRTARLCRSCSIEAGGHRQVVHGHARRGNTTPTYRSWMSMKGRCEDPANIKYLHYGGRGITICDRWHEFANFLADMGARPTDRTLDRIDVNGNYEPGNCRWATRAQQASNRRVTVPSGR